jgi:hypothetical protein
MIKNTLSEEKIDEIFAQAIKTIDGIYNYKEYPELWTANVYLYVSMEIKKEADKMFDKHHNRDNIN